MKRSGSVRRRMPAASAIVGICFAGGTSAGEPAFSDQTAASGVVSNHTFPAWGSFLGGGAVGDFNRDGYQDIYHPTGGATPDRLFINNGDGTFTNQAAAWGIAVTHLGTAATAGDFDGDGWLDLFVTSFGTPGAPSPGRHRLYRNVEGTSFVDVAAAAGVAFSSLLEVDGYGGAFGDYDLDGDLDLAVAGWNDASNGNRLFRNEGDGSFTDVTTSAGLTDLDFVLGFSPRFVDMDGDRYPELIWIGDFATGRYYVNNQDGTFTNFTTQSGTSLAGTEMGQTVSDFNRDGFFDFFVTTISANKLYVNGGDNHFSDQASQAGVVHALWAWGTVAVDVDHDGGADIAVTTQGGRQFLFRNTTTSTGSSLSFEEIALQVGITSSVNGRGVASFDYDNDGDQDLIFFPNNDALTLYRNDLAGDDTHWLRVFLQAPAEAGIAPNGIGSVVKLIVGGESMIGRIDGGSNYLSQSEMSAHFGLGASLTVQELRVEWSNGATTIVSSIPADQTVTVTPAGLLYGDSDGNGLITISDFAAYAACIGGPGSSGGLLGCGVFDFDGDSDVDWVDFARFQSAFGD